MSDQENELWQGLAPDAQVALVTRDYRVQTFSSQVGESGIEAGRLASADRARRRWPRPGSRESKFSRGPFIRSDIAALSANLRDATKAALRNRPLATAMGRSANVRADR